MIGSRTRNAECITTRSVSALTGVATAVAPTIRAAAAVLRINLPIAFGILVNICCLPIGMDTSVRGKTPEIGAILVF